MVTFRSTFIFLLIAAVMMMAAACSSDQSPGQPVAEQEENQPTDITDQQTTAMDQSTGLASPEGDPMTMELTGTVEETDDGIVLATDMGNYKVMGQDLSGMVGETVKVTGAVEESQGELTINVMTVTEAQ